MPDGRRDEYSVMAEGNYKAPYQVFNTLTKIAENHFELRFPDHTVYVYKIPPGTTSLQPFLVEIRDRRGQKLTFGYDEDCKLTTITDALGRVTQLTYNDEDLVTQVTDPFGRSATFEYDSNRNLTQITDMGGYWSKLTYDKDVYITSIENDREKWEFTIEPADGVVAYSDDYPPPGAHTWESYRITIKDPLADKEEYFYHGGCGHAVGINACGYSWYISPKHYVPYESGSLNNFRSAPKMVFYLRQVPGIGEISKVTDFEGHSISFGYDFLTGDRVSLSDGSGNTAYFTYDERGNLTKIMDPLGNGAQFMFDISDRLTGLVDPKGNTYVYEYDVAGNLIKVTDPQGGMTTFTYNPYWQLTSLTDAKNNSIQFNYDTSGNPTSVINPVGGTDSYGYDALGRIISHTDRNGNTKSYKYDAMDRITEIHFPDSSKRIYTYECCGLASVTDSTGTLIFSYDALRRPTIFTDTYGKAISYSYDKNGNLTTLTYPDGKVVRYEYDKADRLIKMIDWLNHITAYDYDAAGNLTRTTYPNGSIITYEYDPSNRLKSILDIKSDAFANVAYDYILDSLGNRTAISLYQPLNVIPSHENVNYTYDTDNRLVTAGNTTFNYHSNGNLMNKTMGNDVIDFSWDYQNRLVQITRNGKNVVFKYDGLGNRIAKIEDSVETRYVIDRSGEFSKVLAETDSNGNILAYYVYGLGLISKISPAGEAYFYHYDAIGSTVGVADSSGNFVNKYSYGPFGKVLGQEEAIANPFKYVGRDGVMDDGIGLLYMRARYYDPEIGRFINKDPIGLLAGINPFIYGENNPLRFSDPSGLDGWDIALSCGSLAVGALFPPAGALIAFVDFGVTMYKLMCRGYRDATDMSMSLASSMSGVHESVFKYFPVFGIANCVHSIGKHFSGEDRLWFMHLADRFKKTQDYY